MAGLKTLRRSITVGAVAMLATFAVAPAGAGASTAPPAGGAGVHIEQTVSDVEVQEVKQINFQGFGCTFHGRSGPASSGQHFAVTAVRSGSGCPSVMVRAFVCGGGSCYTTEWRTGTGQIEYWAPSGHRIVTSYHKCGPCTLTHQINH